MQSAFANQDGLRGHPARNRVDPIGKTFVEVSEVDAGKMVVLTSDAIRCCVLRCRKAKNSLTAFLKAHPLLIEECKPTKGLKIGNRSFDAVLGLLCDPMG